MTAPLVVSCGDPAGIGPDIILETWRQRQTLGVPVFYCHADPDQLRKRATHLGIELPVGDAAEKPATELFDTQLPIVSLPHQMEETPKVPSPGNADGIVQSIERGVADCFDGKASGLVTCPIAKSVLYEAGFAHPGHTEFLAALCEHRTGNKTYAVMMLAGPKLRTVPVTIHIPLQEVSSALSGALIKRTIKTVHYDLKKRFGIDMPRIAVAGLNPHAGEDGALGAEDGAIIAPAIAELRKQGINVWGPLPADTMFHDAARSSYDVAVCMYHDQALIPAKALGFDDAVNVTLGLPIIRTSPDHGTAFDIAGTGEARIYSFVAALKLAAQMAGQE